MKIITFAAIKGGVGKTTLAYNYGEWLAKHNKKVLFIDLDHQCNLTQIYDIYDNENPVANIFRQKGDVTIYPVKANLDLIAGYIRLDQIEKELETKPFKDMLLYMWLEDNYEIKNLKKYDYIIIDCHPDFSTATRNAIIVSHAVISPIIPSEHGYQAKFNLEERLKELKAETFDFKTRESYVTANLYFLGNMIEVHTNSSKELVKAIQEENNVLALVPRKELFNRSTLDKLPLAEMEEHKRIYSKNGEFFRNMNLIFKRITNEI